MSFATYAPTVTVEYYALYEAGIPSNSIQTIFSKILSKGTYFLSFSPMITGDDLTIVAAEIGSQIGGLDEYIACQWVGTPYAYNNPTYEQICMAGTFVSNGEDALTIQVSAESTSDWNVVNYDGTAYNFVIMKLT